MADFIWGQGGEKVTPQQAARQRQMAEALMGQNSTVADNPWDGIAQVARSFTGTQLNNRASEAERIGQEEAAALFGQLDPTSDLSSIMTAAQNPWASDTQRAIAEMLMQQEMQEMDPMRQLQLEKLGLEVDSMKAPPPVDPWAGTQIINDQVVGFGDGGPSVLGDFRTVDEPDPGYRLLSAEEIVQMPNLDPNKAYQVGPDNKVYEIGGGGVNVSVGGDGQRIGSVPSGYAVVEDPTNPSGFRYEMIPNSPEALAQEAEAAGASALEGAQLTSDLESAEKTLSSTRNVLDLIDSSDTPVTGTLSRPFAAFSGTPAGRVRSYVNTLQSGVALGAMQRLKEASATGATGFGALSAPELSLLINDIGALDPDNTEPDIFRETVQRIDDRSKRVVADIRRNVSPERIDELGLRGFLDAIDPQGSPNQSTVDPGDIDALLELYQ